MTEEKFFHEIAKSYNLDVPARNRGEWLFNIGLIETWYYMDDEDD